MGCENRFFIAVDLLSAVCSSYTTAGEADSQRSLLPSLTGSSPGCMYDCREEEDEEEEEV